MKGKSILLALSGSRQSHYAAEVCWQLARKLGSTITAHHVIDSHSAWEFLGHENPGFLASQKYLDVYQELVSKLFVLGEELAQKYAEEAKVLGVDDACIIDEGDPIKQICKRAVDHKMVIIGHRPSTSKQVLSSQFQRLSLAESLAHECPRPLLIVQDECQQWTSLSIMVSLDHINELFINSSLDMAEALGLRPALLCLTGGANEETPENLVRDLRQANERLERLPIALVPAQKELSVSVDQWYAPDDLPFEKQLWDNPLMVIPTRMIAGERITVFDGSPAYFVRYLTLPSIMLWPEEYVFSITRDYLRPTSTAR